MDVHSRIKPLLARPVLSWGELAEDGKEAFVVRFVLADRVVTYHATQLKRWEHVFGVPEMLLIRADRDEIVVEGRDLNEIRAALDLGRLCELRLNYPAKAGVRPGPQVRRITIHAA